MQGAVKKIGIGLAEDAGKVLESARDAGSPGREIICYCRPGTVDKKAVTGTVRIAEHPVP